MADPGFPVGGRWPRRGGGRGLPRWLRFVKFVCQNERIGSLKSATDMVLVMKFSRVMFCREINYQMIKIRETTGINREIHFLKLNSQRLSSFTTRRYYLFCIIFTDFISTAKHLYFMKMNLNRKSMFTFCWFVCQNENKFKWVICLHFADL